MRKSSCGPFPVPKKALCASGTEATMYAVRFARAFKRRDKIVKFEGAYHGGNEFGAISLFPQKLVDFPTPDPTSAGITSGVCRDVLIAPYNDLETTSRIISEYASEIAAVIVEPLHRCTLPVPGFLEGIRKLTREHDILLIFDECVTGFRLAYGGAQEYYGVVPDLAALGKALGGGYPVGAVVGRPKFLICVMRPISGGTVMSGLQALWGGIPLPPPPPSRLWGNCASPEPTSSCSRWRKTSVGFRDIVGDLGFAAQVLGDGPLCALAFTDEQVVDYRTAFRADSAKARAFTLGLFRRGIFLNPMSTKLYISLAHGPEEIQAIHAAGRKVLQEIAS